MKLYTKPNQNAEISLTLMVSNEKLPPKYRKISQNHIVIIPKLKSALSSENTNDFIKAMCKEIIYLTETKINFLDKEVLCSLGSCYNQNIWCVIFFVLYFRWINNTVFF